MKYIIELVIIFSPADKTLTFLNDSNHEVMLSNQSTRLLLEMVTNAHETLHREDLLKRVWEDYGFTRSNNSLNVAVSEIRKALELFGRDPKIITTIPKVGFRFDGTVEAAIQQAQPQNEPSPSHNENNSNANASGKKSNRVANQKKALILSSFLLMIFLSYLLYDLFFMQQPLSVTKVNTLFLYSAGKCNVYALGSAQAKYDDNFVSRAKENIQREGIDCSLNQTDIFYKNENTSSQVSQMSFIGICKVDGKNKYSNCLTIKNRIGGSK